jgi:predicted ATPase
MTTVRPGALSASTREFPPFCLDLINQCLWRNRDQEEQRILLPPKAFLVLHYLVEHAGRLVTQNELLEALWPETNVQPEVLKSHIRDVRVALEDDPKVPRFIETLPRRGYRFIASVHDTRIEPAVDLPSGKLVGRNAQLAELHQCLRKVLRNQSQVVFITGEPGIGKTALVDEFLCQAAQSFPGMRIGRGQCVEGFGGKEPYYPMLEALGQLCVASGRDAVTQALYTQAPTWLVQFPSLVSRKQREMLQAEIVGATRGRMLREIGESLETITSDKPLLLVLENLHWVDPSTVDLISALARRRTSGKLMLICTYRSVHMRVGQDPLKTVAQDLLVHQLCREFPLTPLTEADVAEFLAIEAAVPEGLATLMHRHSGGNPLFLAAAVAQMREQGLIAVENGSWQMKVPQERIRLEAPESLRQMIELQIETLSAEEQRALEAASVNGISFTTNDHGPGANVDQEKFVEVCEDLSRRQHIVRRAGSHQFADGTVSQRYEFAHALYREVFYRRQTPRQRAKLQLQVSRRPGEGLATAG